MLRIQLNRLLVTRLGNRQIGTFYLSAQAGSVNR